MIRRGQIISFHQENFKTEINESKDKNFESYQNKALTEIKLRSKSNHDNHNEFNPSLAVNIYNINTIAENDLTKSSEIAINILSKYDREYIASFLLKIKDYKLISKILDGIAKNNLTKSSEIAINILSKYDREYIASFLLKIKDYKLISNILNGDKFKEGYEDAYIIDLMRNKLKSNNNLDKFNKINKVLSDKKYQ